MSDEAAGETDPGGPPDGIALPPEPVMPTQLPSVAPVEYVQALLDRLGGLDSDIERVEAIREELRALRALGRYLASWRSVYCSWLWLTDVPVHIIAKAAGVADTFVSRRARELGFPPRRIDKRRSGQEGR